MQIQFGDAEKTIRSFFYAYLIQRDLNRTASFLTDHVQWIGTGKFEMAHDKRGALRLIENEFAADTTPYRISFSQLTEQVISASCSQVICNLNVSATTIAQQNFTLELHITATCVAVDNNCKIAAIHASLAAPLQEDSDSFPLSFAKGTKEDFQRRISRKLVDLLNKNIPGGMMGGYVEEDFPLYFINDRMLHYLGYTYEEFVADTDDKVINCMHPDDRQAVDRAVQIAFRANQEYEIQYRMRKKDGSYIWVNDVGRKSLAEDGREVCLSVIRDITTEKETHYKLKAEIAEKEKQSHKYNHLFQSVLCGIVQYHLNPDASVIFKDANKEAMRIFGYEPEEFWAKNDWYLPDLIAKEDQSIILNDLIDVTEVGLKNSFEYRLCQKDKSSCWIIGTAEIIKDTDGETLIQSVFLDIDQRKKIELSNKKLTQQVAAGNELLKMALEHTSTHEFYYYPQERLCVVPERTSAHFQCAQRYENMPLSFAHDFITDESYADFFQMYEKIHQGEKTACCEFKAKKGGDWCHVTLSSIGYTDDNRPAFAVGIVEDITNEKMMSFALQEERYHDKLTGLYTKEVGIAKVKDYMEQKSPQQICAIMILDLDDFKEINAEEGTVFADAILQDVADILRAETGKDDISIRLGGDEFMLFIKDCDKARATILGPRIIKRISDLYGNDARHIKVSASIGMCVTAVIDEYSGLYRCAESSLLYVKENGKGKAACYLDTSNELGMALTQVYANEHLFNEIDSQTVYRTDDMVDFALELLGRSKKLDDAIFLLLSRIGKRYGFDRVSIMETDSEYLSFHYSYQWAANRSDLRMKQSFYLSSEAYASISELYGEDGIYEKPFHQDTSMPSCLQAAVWNQGVYAGALVFESKKENYPWSDEQKKLIKEITKLLSSFIMKARADAVSQAKTEFLSRMSHEIRTPMNAISGMTTIAKTVLDDKDKALDCLNKIESANEYLLRLINDILDMSRIESGKIELNYEAADLGYQLGKLHTLMSPQAAEKNIELEFIYDYAENRPMNLDILRLNQVMINIIGNAVKFTLPQGKITVSVQQKEQNNEQIFLGFSVRDTGIGISKESLNRIFNVFEQGTKDTVTQYGGTGLGLSISARLVQMMGGTLEVKSQLNKGSEFYFTLPFSFADEQDISNSEPVPQQTQDVDKTPPVDFHGKRVLLAEDNELNCEIGVAILNLQGFIVETAVNGQEALDRFFDQAPYYYDAILMDINMPVMDGLQATRKIRTCGKEDSRTIPIIAMTANAFDEDTKKSMDSGMNGHLSKPIIVEQLIDTLSQCLSHNQCNKAPAIK